MRKCAKQWRWSWYCVKESSHLCLGIANPGLHRDPCGFTQTEFAPDKTKSKRSHSTTVVLSNKHQEPLTSKNLQLQATQVRLYLPTRFLFFKTTCVSSCTLAFVYLLLFNSPVLACWCFWTEKALQRVALCWTAVWREQDSVSLDRLQHCAQSRYGWLQKHASLKILPLN